MGAVDDVRYTVPQCAVVGLESRLSSPRYHSPVTVDERIPRLRYQTLPHRVVHLPQSVKRPLFLRNYRFLSMFLVLFTKKKNNRLFQGRASIILIITASLSLPFYPFTVLRFEFLCTNSNFPVSCENLGAGRFSALIIGAT
jgi:hypothetical protein